jgi:phosphatidate cytidylyltransferase
VSNTSYPRSTSSELRARIASALVLGVVAVFGLLGGGIFFALIVAGVAFAALAEWNRLVNGGHTSTITYYAGGLVAMATIWLLVSSSIIVPIFIVGLAAVITVVVAALRKTSVPWHVAGILYIGIPALALVSLREYGGRGAAIVGGLFAAVWAADIGALFVGRWLRGPKLFPALSPNKTWAGFLGGIIAASLVEAIYVWILGGAGEQAAVFGAFLGLVAHGGDLFESWVKRCFRAKNTGDIIPGHGGVLDRVDSLLFAAPMGALLIFVFGLNPLFGGNP